MKWPTTVRLIVLPGLVFILALVVQAGLLWLDHRAQAQQLRTEVAVTAQQAGLRLQTWINDRIAIGRFLVARVENDYAEPAEYVKDAAALLESFGGVQTINWNSADGTIEVVYPRDGNEAALGKNLLEHPTESVRETLLAVMEMRQPLRTPATVELFQGGRGFVAYLPAEDATGDLLGTIAVVFRVSDVVAYCFDDNFLSNFQSAILTIEGQEVYSSVPDGPSREWPGAQSTETTILGRPWTLTIAPVAAQRQPVAWLTPPRIAGSLGIAALLALAAWGVLRLRERSRQSERNLVQFASSVHEVFWLASPDFQRIYYISPAYETLWGKKLDTGIYDNPNWWLESVVDEDRPLLEKRYRELYAGGFESNDLPLHRVRREDGELRWIEARVYPIRDRGGELVRVAGVDEDVTARVEANRERERLMAAIEQTAESVAITDADGVLLYVNRAYEKTYGVDRAQCLGHRAAPLADTDTETARSIAQALDAGNPWTSQVESSGEHGPLEITEITISPVLDEAGNRTNLVIIGRDVSRELQLERQLLQSQRLESVGLLAGGIAHDFNNLLQALYGYVDLAQMHLNEPERMAGYLKNMREAIERARQHVRKILLYARRAERRHEAWPVQDLVREVTSFLRPSTPSTIRFEVSTDESCPPALISPSDIHQVLVNLCTNAFHAMPTGGVLRVGVQPKTIGEGSAEWSRLAPGDYVSLVVEDTGVGISDEDVQKIFEPYFTTKSKEEGTGLGLSVVQGIVVAHGGAVRVQTGRERGSRFEILLPVAGQDVAPDGSAMDGVPAPFQPAHVLLVDDEPAVLDVLKASLVAGGYSVDAFSDPREALGQFERTPDAYDLIVTDQTMPNMKGIELAAQLRVTRPDIPILLISGLESDDDEPTNHVDRRMTKPIRPSELIEAVRQELRRLERV